MGLGANRAVRKNGKDERKSLNTSGPFGEVRGRGFGEQRDTFFAVRGKLKGIETDGGQRPQEAHAGQCRGKTVDMALLGRPTSWPWEGKSAPGIGDVGPANLLRGGSRPDLAVEADPGS